MTGIDGNYRMTCESVMRVLRAHKDSVMAVLEAFVYDPLLNWRLMDCKLHTDYTFKALPLTFFTIFCKQN